MRRISFEESGLLGRSFFLHIDHQSPLVYELGSWVGITDADQVTFSSLPDGLSFVPERGTFEGDVAETLFEETTMTVVSDGVVWEFELVFYCGASPIGVSQDSMSGRVGDGVSYLVEFGGDSEQASTGHLGLPPGLVFDPATRMVSGTYTSRGSFFTIFWAKGDGSSPPRLTYVSHRVEESKAGEGVDPGPLGSALVAPPPHYAFSRLIKGRDYGGIDFSGVKIGPEWLPPTVVISAQNLPTGLVESNGRLTGVPTQTGFWQVEAVGMNAEGVGRSVHDVLVIDLEAGPPALDLPERSDLSLGEPFEFSVTSPVAGAQFWATHLPDGIVFDPMTGLVSGVPSTPGEWVAQFWANSGGKAGDVSWMRMVVHESGAGLATIHSTAIIGAPTDTLAVSVEHADNLIEVVVTGAPGPFAVRQGTAWLDIEDWPVGRHQIELEVRTTVGAVSGVIEVEIVPTREYSFWPVVPLETIFSDCPQEPGPYLNNMVSAQAVVGRAFSSSFRAFAGDFVTYRANGLPDGLAIDMTTGDISGVPLEPGVFNAQIIAEDLATIGWWEARIRVWPSSAEVTVYLGNELYVAHSGLVRLLPGEQVNFEARASGREPKYRWYRDGEPLSDGGGLHGSGTKSLKIDAATAEMAGVYSVIVNSSDGPAHSSPFPIVVGESFAEWAARVDASAGGSNAEFRNSGLSLLEAYAFGVDSAANAAAPLEVEEIEGIRMLVFRKPADVSDIRYALEHSCDLDTGWSEVVLSDGPAGLMSDLPDETLLVWPLPDDESCFYRLRVSEL